MSPLDLRRQQVWDAAAWQRAPELLKEASVDKDVLELQEASEGEEIVFDYAAMGLSLRRHPLALLCATACEPGSS